MLIDGTGTGKSTLIDGMVNYILGFNWADSFRFTIVTPEEDEDRRKSNQVIYCNWFSYIKYIILDCPSSVSYIFHDCFMH